MHYPPEDMILINFIYTCNKRHISQKLLTYTEDCGIMLLLYCIPFKGNNNKEENLI